MTPRDAARAYADLGWLVFPVKSGEKRPATEHGLLDATTSEAQINAWWDENPAYNVGVVTSRKSGIWVLDEDVEHDTGVLVGEMSLAELCAKHGQLPPHPIAVTPRGGRHHVFAYPDDGEDLPRRIKFAPGLDALGSRMEDGEERAGYFAAFPSVVGAGRYKWEVLPSKVTPPQAPGWLVTAIRSVPEAEPIEIRRSDTTTKYGRVALEAECAKLAATPPGSQDDTLIRVASRIGSLVAAGEIETGEARSALLDAGMRMVPSGRPWTPRELESKINRGFKHGAKSPYQKREPDKPKRTVPRLAVNNNLAEAQPQERPDDWMMGLPWQVKKKEDPGIRHNLKPADAINCHLMIEHHPELRGMYAYNAFTDTVVISRGLDGSVEGYPRQLTDADDANLCSWLNWHWIAPSIQTTRLYLRTVALKRSFDPLIDYIKSLKWDGKPRIDRWLTYYAAAVDSEYSRIIGRKFLVSAIARALKPGCKVDAMLILEGRQSIGKSTLPYVLFGAEYFTDQVGDVRNKDSAERIQGAWCVEIPEMDKFSRVEANAVKSFLSQRDDRYRPAYGHNAITRPRRCVFFGTINPDGAGYLRDTTGNRRFWPVAVESIDLDALRTDRDQIWAEARTAYENRESWWLTREEDQIAAPEQEARQQEMILEPRIREWIEQQDAAADGYVKFNMYRLLADLKVDTARMESMSRIVGPVLRKIGCEAKNNRGRYWEIKRYG